MGADRMRMVLGVFWREGLCHYFMQSSLCRSTKQTCRGDVNPRSRKLRGWIVFLLEIWNSGTSWKLLGEFREVVLVLSQSCWESWGSTPGGGCTCKRTRGQVHSPQQPGLSGEREFAKYALKNLLITIAYKQKQKRAEQNKSRAEWLGLWGNYALAL